MDFEFKDKKLSGPDMSFSSGPNIEYKVSMEDLKLLHDRLIEDANKSPERMAALGKILYSTEPFIPKGEIWFMHDGKIIGQIINVGESRLFKFICWFQDLFNKLKGFKKWKKWKWIKAMRSKFWMC